MSFEILSDERFALTDSLALPTFEYNSMRLIKRMAVFAEHGRIVKVFYPVFPPNANADTVLEWLKKRRCVGQAHLSNTPAKAGSILPALSILQDQLSVYRLPPDSAIPDWASRSAFLSVVKTNEETSIVCRSTDISQGVQCDSGWRCIKVAGPLDFALTGILSGILSPLAKAEISIFAVSTYDTDYVLVKEDRLQAATDVLSRAGYHFVNAEPAR